MFAACILSIPPCKLSHRGLCDLLQHRCRRWVKGEAVALWAEATAVQKKRLKQRSGRDQSKCTYVLDDDELPPGWGSEFGVATEADQGKRVSEEAMDRASRLVKQGQFSKASAALSPGRTAEPNEETTKIMRAKHPVGNKVELPDGWDTGRLDPAEFDPYAVLKVLKSFKPGSAPGPTGLRAQHLVDMCTVSSSDTIFFVTRLLWRIAAGRVPPSFRHLLFGAKVVALVKTTRPLDLRPIACGEVLRRAAAKALCAQVKEQARDLFLENNQVGVAVPGGAESLVVIARRLTAAWLADDELKKTKALLKVDIKNAFNSADRSAILRAVLEHFPTLAGYVQCAYGDLTSLYFGETPIDSACGVQQGDPLGPLLFSLVLIVLNDKVKEALKRAGVAIQIDGWYLDDGTFGGDIGAVKLVYETIRKEGPKLGLVINEKKCEIVSDAPAAVIRHHFGDEPALHPLNDWCLLGTPCGDAEHIIMFVDKKLERAIAKVKLVGQIPDAMVRYALLRYCASFGLAVYYMRTAGPGAHYELFDDAVEDVFNDFVPAGNPRAWQQAQLPVRLGGLGLRSAAKHAPIAFTACSADAARYIRNIIIADNPESLLAKDPAGRCITTDLLAKHQYPQQVQQEVLGQRPPRSQRDMSLEFEGTRLQALVKYTTPKDLIRFRALSPQHAGAWLACLPRRDANIWMDNECFTLLLKYRFGLRLGSQDGSRCVHCGKPADAEGHHSATCGKSGNRIALHDLLRDILYHLARDAGASHVQKETPAKAKYSKSGGRMDVVFSLDGQRYHVDVGVCHPHAKAYAKSAVKTSLGAAEIVVGRKRDKYAGHISDQIAMGGKHVFVAAICETYGGFAPEFVALLKKLAGHWGNRSGLPRSRAVQLVMQQFSLTLAKNFASLVLAPNARSCGDSIAALRNATGPAAATARPALPALDVMAFGTRSADSDDDANVVEDFGGPSYRQHSVTSSTSWSMPRDLVELSSSLARASGSAV